MPDLFLGKRQVNTLFNLLGDRENDITYSLGWALAGSDTFLKTFLETVRPKFDVGETESVKLQVYDRKRGITDVEIKTSRLHLVIEAKRGWTLPHANQLRKYARRFRDPTRHCALAVITECSDAYARERLPKTVKGLPLYYLSWNRVAEILEMSRHSGKLAERHLLKEFLTYLRGVMHMKDHESNLVYVVPLGSGTPKWSKLSWVEFVTEKKCYFHPNGRKGWTKIPPNYLAFRYGGKLQHIHHVEDVQVVSDLSDHIPEIYKAKWRARREGTLFLYKLGEPIFPKCTVRTGKVYASGHSWAAIDLLLTSSTIKEAVELTKKRNKKD